MFIHNTWNGLKNLSLNQRWTLGIAFAVLVFSLIGNIISFSSNLTNSRGIDGSLAQGAQANQLSKVLVDNSKRELETAQKKLSFDIINTLYKDFYQFDEHNALVIRKLKNKEHVDDDFYLGLYLSGFEDLYEQCKSGLIAKEQIRIHFQHLINPLCDNQQVEGFLQQRGNGLKLLCRAFYPDSRLSTLSKPEKASCQ